MTIDSPDAPPRPSAPVLFLIDGYALIYRAFFALLTRPLRTAHGENTSAAWGVVNFLQRLLKQHKPDYVGWIHDAGVSFRKELLPEYKATREKLSEELQADFDQGVQRIEELLEAFHVPVLSVPSYEADDVIGTLARQAVDQGVNVVIVSGDKDFQQLVRPGVWLLNPGRGGPASVEEQWVDVHNAAERLGVPPEHVTDYLALVGDASDNVPGVPGIGAKTARELITEFGGLEKILAAAPGITRKRPREALAGAADRARLSRELVTIHEDVPITLDLMALRQRAPDRVRLRRLYVDLEFTSLLRELESPDVPSTRDREVRYRTVDDLATLAELIAEARAGGSFVFDTETIPDAGAPAGVVDPLRARLVGISIALRPGDAWYLPFAHRVYEPAQTELLAETGDSGPPSSGVRRRNRSAPRNETSIAERLLRQGAGVPVNLPPVTSEELRPLRDLFADASVKKSAQNAKFDVLVLRRAGVEVRGLDVDTMIASYVLDPGRRSHGLDLLALEFLDHHMTSYEDLCGRGRHQLPFDVVPVGAARDYSCEDADYTLRLRSIFLAQLESQGLLALFREIEMALVDVLVDMEYVGVSIDVGWFASLRERFDRERRRIEQEIYAEAGETFNINSNTQLRTILFEKLKLPIRKRTATGPSTDASVLQALAEEGHQLPVLLMEYRELAKLQSTYLETLPALVHPDDQRLHTSFNQTVAATGRLSSSDPNLQNIPVRRELGREIRRGFIARPGWMLVVADYSQIELRLLAHLSRDEAFVAAFARGGDIHRETAARIFGVAVEDVSSEMRARAKTINFATIYGQGPVSLARQLRISIEDARNFIATYFERFSGVRRFLDQQVEFARAHGYVETIFRRRRYVPELRDRNFNIRAFGERIATNAPIQGSAADLIKIAMIRTHESFARRAMQSRMILQVHDELVVEAAPTELELATEVLRHEMEHAESLSVPLVVDIGQGANWVDAKG